MPTTTTTLSHVAMSVPPGTLSEDFRTELVDFYGTHLGWSEMEALGRPDRLTISMGGPCYLNLREKPDVMVCHGYEHIGVVVGSAGELRRVWNGLDADPRDVGLEPLDLAEDGGYGSFRFRYLLPMALEMQWFG